MSVVDVGWCFDAAPIIVSSNGAEEIIVSSNGAERRRSVLSTIEGLVCRDRNAVYGDAGDNFKNIAGILNIVLQRKLSAPLDNVDVAIISAAIKMGRLIETREHLDSWLDLAGYVVCGAGILTDPARKK